MTPALWVVAMLVTVSTIYLGAAVAYHYALRPGMVLCFAGYIIANLGLVIDALQK